MSEAVIDRRLLAFGALALLIIVTVVVVARVALTGILLNTALRSAGASDISFKVTRVSPWRVVVEDLGFHVQTQEFGAGRVTVARSRWWIPSLGSVRVEEARMPVSVDGADPWKWA